jgi:type I restriction enzyme S subunit
VKTLEHVPIKSLCLKVTTGGTPSRSNFRYWEGGDIPWFKTGELNDWYLGDSQEQITEEGLENSAAKRFPSGTVLMALYGDGKTITTLGLLRNEATTNQACCAMIADPKRCHYLYLFYALKHHRRELLQLVVAGAQRNLSNGIVRNFRILYRPLPIQCRLAGILSAYDDLIANNRRRMALLEESARQLYQEWFVRLRFPGHEHTRITDGVPEGWERRTLGDLCSDLREIVSPNELDPATPYIGLEHIPRRSISLAEWGRADSVTSSKLRYRVGDVLFGKIRPYFHKVGIAFTDGVTSSDAIVLRPNSDETRALLLMTASSDRFVAEVSQTMREGSKMPRADLKVMKNYSVPAPPPGILDSFSDMIDTVTDQLRVLCFQNQKLRLARDLLLPRLMSGEIAV